MGPLCHVRLCWYSSGGPTSANGATATQPEQPGAGDHGPAQSTRLERASSMEVQRNRGYARGGGRAQGMFGFTALKGLLYSLLYCRQGKLTPRQSCICLLPPRILVSLYPSQLCLGVAFTFFFEAGRCCFCAPRVSWPHAHACSVLKGT